MKQDISLEWALWAYEDGRGYSLQLNDGKVIDVEKEEA